MDVIQRALRDEHTGSSRRRTRAARRRFLARYHRSETVSSFGGRAGWRSATDRQSQLDGNAREHAGQPARSHCDFPNCPGDGTLEETVHRRPGSLRHDTHRGLLQRQHEFERGQSRFQSGSIEPDCAGSELDLSRAVHGRRHDFAGVSRRVSGQSCGLSELSGAQCKSRQRAKPDHDLHPIRRRSGWTEWALHDIAICPDRRDRCAAQHRGARCRVQSTVSAVRGEQHRHDDDGPVRRTEPPDGERRATHSYGWFIWIQRRFAFATPGTPTSATSTSARNSRSSIPSAATQQRECRLTASTFAWPSAESSAFQRVR